MYRRVRSRPLLATVHVVSATDQLSRLLLLPGFRHLRDCGLTDDDLDHLSNCFDTYGREYLTHL